MLKDGAFSHKIYYVTIFKEIFNIEGHPNCITSSKVTVIWLNGWILPIGGASAVKGLCLPKFSKNFNKSKNKKSPKNPTKKI